MNSFENGLCLTTTTTTTTNMFCWGNTTNGELGLGGIEDQHILVPRELKFQEANKVKYVACGNFHSLLITESGLVFSCGSNDFYQLGHSKSQTKFGQVDSLSDYVIHKISCGDTHSIATNEWGEVFSWGNNSHGQLGYVCNEEHPMKPRIVKNIATCVVVQVCCGSNHSLALTNNGDLYSWGSNECGQLGLGHKFNSSTPALITSLAGIPLAFIASGGNHCFVLSKSGAVFGWGKNCFGQLGLNSEQDQVFPGNLRTLRSIRVKYIACGEDFSVFLTQDGGVFTCGAGQYGQLGHGTTANEILPRKVLELMGSTVTQICCGRRHTLAFVPSRGRVYAFGLGSAGQLGTRALLNCNTPQVVLGPWVSPGGVAVVETGQCKLDFVIKRIFAGGDQCFVTVNRQKDNILPEDCREFKSDSQILVVTLERMIECQNLVPDCHIPDDLITYLETVMGSLSCLNGSFLLSDERHFCCSSQHHGVDMKQAEDCFNSISRVEHQSVNDIISECLMDKIIKKLSPSPPDVESLRIYLTLPLYHQFANAKNSSRLQGPFGAALLNLRTEAARIIGLWYRSLTSDYFERLIRIYQNVLLNSLKTEGESGGVTWTENMEISLEILARLNRLNQVSTSDNLQRNQANAGLKVPYDTFYMPEISERVDVRIDYVKWIVEKDENGRRPIGRRYLCTYPFIFDAEAKLSLLQTDQMMQMRCAMNEAASQAFSQLFFSPIVNPNISQYLELHISRENIVQDTLRELSSYSERDYKKPLKVTFIGEEAEDAGGVRKEFFMLLLKEILDPKYGMFRSYEETNTIWFSEDSFEDEIMYYLIGLLCGLVIYNFTIISLPFPLALYKKLLGEPVTLQDVKALSPVLAKSMQDLLDYDEADLQDVFCLNFELTREVFGEVKCYELKPGGKNIPVTLENKLEFVNLYVDFLLNTSVSRHYTAFHNAFHKVSGGGGYILKLFHAQELMAVIIGNECYDWDVFESSASYRGGYTSSDPTIRLFWEVFHELSQEDKRKFLLFLTGCDRVPIQGMKGIKIMIQPTHDTAYLPVAHTCFNLLDLPRYSTKEKLKYKLLQAIQQNIGFSLI